jgi:hypothetical protein
VFAAPQGLEWLILDLTVVRAHPCAGGAKKEADGSGWDRQNRRWAAAGAGSGRRSTPPSTIWACR